MNKYIIRTLISITVFIFLNGCQKQDDWLNVKRLSLDVTPSSLEDFQALLNNVNKLNMRFSSAGLLGTDNITLSDENFLSIPKTEQNLYTFNKNIWINGTSDDWNYSYATIEYANIVLDGLKNLKNIDVDNDTYKNIRGQALFFRAFAIFNLSQLFCKPYFESSANTDLGVPVRLSSDVNKIYPRSTLNNTYKQMLQDALDASTLLPVTQANNFRPNKSAAFGLLAKIYLVMGNYGDAKTNADKAISLGSVLIDFNDPNIVSATATYPFSYPGINNPGIVFNASSNLYISLGAGPARKGFVNKKLYNSYIDTDLRKSIFYKLSGDDIIFNGSYSGSQPNFSGIATNELFLIRSECYARLGNVDAAISDLNTLLEKRFLSGTYTDISLNDSDSALKLILAERRKELPFTGNIRWEDLRRLNSEPEFQLVIEHNLAGKQYILRPNDPKYVLPIPDDEIQLSNIQQNIR